LRRLRRSWLGQWPLPIWKIGTRVRPILQRLPVLPPTPSVGSDWRRTATNIRKGANCQAAVRVRCLARTVRGRRPHVNRATTQIVIAAIRRRAFQAKWLAASAKRRIEHGGACGRLRAAPVNLRSVSTDVLTMRSRSTLRTLLGYVLPLSYLALLVAGDAKTADAPATGSSCTSPAMLYCGTCSVTCAVGQTAVCTPGKQEQSVASYIPKCVELPRCFCRS
jgi:hypothetical protein